MAIFLKNTPTPRVKSVREGLCESEIPKGGDQGSLSGRHHGMLVPLWRSGFTSQGKGRGAGVFPESLCFDRTTAGAVTAP